MITVVNPQSVGLSSKRLGRVTRWLENLINSERLAGASVLINRRGRVACFESSGMTSSIADYARFCQMLMNDGELQGERLLARKTVHYMRQNHLPDNRDMAAMGQPLWSETTYEGIGFGLGFAVVLDPVKAQMITSVGEHHWGGAASTFFWLDPQEDLFVVFFSQLMPSSTYPIRRELRTRVYQALLD